MEARHQRSLFSTYLALQQLAEEVRCIAGRGVSPAHAAGQMTPLPAPECQKLERELDALLSQARDLLVRHAPGLLAEHERARPPAHTRAWIDGLLARVEAMVDDMDPTRLGTKYGALDPPDVTDLEHHLTAMRAHLRHLRGRK